MSITVRSSATFATPHWTRTKRIPMATAARLPHTLLTAGSSLAAPLGALSAKTNSSVSFERKETEEFVFADRAPNGAAKLLPAVRRVCGSLAAVAIGILFVRVQCGVAKVAEERTVIDIGALFRDHVDCGAL